MKKYVPRSIQNIFDRVSAFNESITEKLFTEELAKTFEVVVYTSLVPAETKTPTMACDASDNKLGYHFYSARSKAGHHDHLVLPESAKTKDEYEKFRNAHFQAIIKNDVDKPPQSGDVWIATHNGGNLVTLVSKQREGAIVTNFKEEGPAKNAHSSSEETTQLNGDYIDTTAGSPEQTSYDTSGSPGVLPAVDATQKKILNFISKREGSYNASNNGTKYTGSGIVNSIPGTSYVAEGLVTKTKQRNDQKLLSTMTISEIKKLQGWNKNWNQRLYNSTYPSPKYKNTRTLFAVGAYQIIPATMMLAVKDSGLSDSDIFNEANQDKLGLALIYGSKRPKLRDYLKGSETVTLDQAHTDFALEWASVPKPNGKTAYKDGANRAGHTAAEVQNVLKEVRALNIKNGFTV